MPKMWALTVWRLKHGHRVTLTMQAAKAWQQHLRLPTTGSAGTYLTACLLQKRQNVSSSFITLDKKNNMSRLWRREEFLKICIEKGLAENAQAIEVTIPVKKSQKTRYNLHPESFFVSRLWGRWPDGVAINKALQIEYITEFKRSRDRQWWEITKGKRSRSKWTAHIRKLRWYTYDV